MTYLPHHRRAISGRTHHSPYRHADYAGIYGPYGRATSTAERAAGVLLAVAIGVLLAAALLHWWSA